MFQDKSEIGGIMETLALYRDCTYNGCVETLRKVFHPRAVLSGWVVTPLSPDGALMCDSMEMLYGMMKPEEAPCLSGEEFRFHVDSIEIDGDIACAKVLEENLDGGNYANFLQLHRVDGRWVVTSKSFRQY